MNLSKRLARLQQNLENFDLESFFHDETFFEILEDREYLANNANKLSVMQANNLYNIDRIIDSYYNIYKNKNLSAYAKMSFELLKNVEKISSQSLQNTA